MTGAWTLGEDGWRSGGMRKRHCVWRTMFRTMLDVVPCKERRATGVTAKRSLAPSPRHIRLLLIGCPRHVHLQLSRHHGTGSSILVVMIGPHVLQTVYNLLPLYRHLDFAVLGPLAIVTRPTTTTASQLLHHAIQFLI